MQFPPACAREPRVVGRPGRLDAGAACQPVGEHAGGERIGFRRVVGMDDVEILRDKEGWPLGSGGQEESRFPFADVASVDGATGAVQNLDRETGSIVVVIQMLQELGQIVALEGVFRDRVPDRLGVMARDHVIGGSQRKSQVIGIRDIPARRGPGEDCERLQIGIPRGWDLADGVVFLRFLAAGANGGESPIDPVLVALQAHLHRSVRVVPGGTGEIEHDRLLLDHGPEADLLDLGAGDRGRNGLSAGGAHGQQGACTCENCGKQQGGSA